MLSQVVVVLALLLATVSAQDIVSDCPIPNGYFADSIQCDKYYECVDNVLTEKVCVDGMAFNDLNHRVEKCDFIYQVDCTSRPELQTPQASENCPRANGYYAHPEPNRCSAFFFCNVGHANPLVCPESLVFSLKTGTCVWPDEAGRTGDCNAGNVVNFTCPKEKSIVAVAHPRYADPEDCQYFYVCINGKVPRRNGCNFGQVFNSVLGACDLPKTVPECAEYYVDYFTEYFATLKGNVPAPEILQAAVNSGYKVPEVAKRIRVRPSSSSFATGPDGVRRRRPTVTGADRPEVISPFHRPQIADEETIRQELEKNPPPPKAPVRRRRPSRPLSGRRTTTATTTTTTQAPPPPPLDYPAEDYVYYDDYPADPDADTALPGAAVPASRLPPRTTSRN